MVELFTSQGCSSCPPADSVLGELAQRDDVIALAMHVDYWDYLGWKDTFAQPRFTERQFRYREQMGARVVYTPQMIVHGLEDIAGYRVNPVLQTISSIAAAPTSRQITLNRQDGGLTARIEPGAAVETCTIWVAMYQREATVKIERGENAGRKITYHNVVQDLMSHGQLSGESGKTLTLPDVDSEHGVAVWLQDDRSGRVMAASFFED